MAAQLLAAIAPDALPSPSADSAYRSRLILAALSCLVLPVGYLALLGGLAAGLFWYYRTIALPLQGGPLLLAAAWSLPGLVGGLLIGFLLKPLVAPRSLPPASVRLEASSEPEFFAMLAALSRVLGVSQPVSVHVVAQANAWVQFEHGWLGWRTGCLRLNVGLPLLAGLETEQLVGVLAHELGHCRQRAGMRFGFVIHALNAWLRSRALDPDDWDQRLAHWRSRGAGLHVVLVAAVCSSALELTRGWLRALHALGERAAAALAWQMEFDADRCEVALVGSRGFAETAQRLRALELAFRQTEASSVAAVVDGLPPLDLSLAVLGRLAQYDGACAPLIVPGKGGRHPGDAERIARALAVQAPGVFQDRRTARGLLRHFETLSVRVTEGYYRDLRLHGVFDLPLRSGRRPEEGALMARSSNEYCMPEAIRLEPLAAERSPWRTLSWRECVNRLHASRPAWEHAMRHRRRRDERLRVLAPMIALLDHQVPFRLADGRLPDAAALRAEVLLLRADAGPAVLADVPGLQARRLQCAIQAMPPAVRGQAQALWRQQQQLFRLASEQAGLADLSHAVLVLAWNQEMDLDQVEVAYVLARYYRMRMTRWLELAATVVLDEAGVPLADFLLPRCPLLAEQGNDDIGYVEALKPMHAEFKRIAEACLDRLLVLVAQAEEAAGLSLERASAG